MTPKPPRIVAPPAPAEHRGLDHKGVMRTCIQELCLNDAHYPMPEPVNELTADPRLHWAIDTPCFSGKMKLKTAMRERCVNTLPRDNEPLGGPMPSHPTTTTRKFWAKIDKDGPPPEFRPSLGACWLWLGYISPQGYGKLTRERRQIQAHRYTYELLGGTIPADLDLDHLCRVRHCVRPEHMEPVTRKENAQRGAHGRLVRHCPRGHAYDEANTYVTKAGRRDCRACHRAEVKAANAAKR